jgi:hypothetical protein
MQRDAGFFMHKLALIRSANASSNHVRNERFTYAGKHAKRTDAASNVSRFSYTCFGIFLSHGAHCTLLADKAQLLCQLIKYILCKIIYKYA